MTVMTQVARAAMEAPQVLVCEKSAALAPAMAMLVIVTVDFVAFVSVTDCDRLGVLTF